jgi:ATP-dependent DNA ligase
LTRDGAKRASYVAFDLVRVDGKDIRLRGLDKRRAALQQVVDRIEGVVFSGAIN